MHVLQHAWDASRRAAPCKDPKDGWSSVQLMLGALDVCVCGGGGGVVNSCDRDMPDLGAEAWGLVAGG
jgi:hypothetical protein